MGHFDHLQAGRITVSTPEAATVGLIDVVMAKSFFEKSTMCSLNPAVLSVGADSVVTDQAPPEPPTRREVAPMTAPIAEPGPDEEQPPGGAPRPDAGQAHDDHGSEAGRPHDGAGQEIAPEAEVAWGGLGWTWVPGSADTGPVPARERLGPPAAGPSEDGLPAGLDYAALLDALAASGVLDADPEDQDSEGADREAAEAEGRVTSADPARVAAEAVEHMDPGPAQAGWLEVAAGGADRLDEYGLAGVAIANRRAASRAQAAELAAVARICAAAAKADPKIGVKSDGRPARVGRDALGQIAMALKLTPYGAEEWADLAVTLAWRLPATGAALAAGRVDLDRAEAIANATSVLDEDTARAVEEKILPEAGTVTRALLRDRLARAVLAAAPEGAERCPGQAERAADVRRYDVRRDADDDQTATITASKLAQIEAAAGFARVTALARARKAAGLPGSLGFHRGQVLIGMMLGTLPFIPPPDGAPPDQPPPDDPGPDDGDGPRDDHPR